MLIYEVLSLQPPFYQHQNSDVSEMVIRGDRPERPEGIKGALFTDDLWEILSGCWAPEPQSRPKIKDILQFLEKVSKSWVPPPRKKPTTPASANEVSFTTPTTTSQLDREPKQVGDVGIADKSRICPICAEPVRYYSLSECNHRTCHVCAVRLQVLWKRLDCTVCQKPQPLLIFTTSPNATYQSFKLNFTPRNHAKPSFFFETKEIREETWVLLRFACPDGGCDYVTNGWSELKLHVREAHGKLMCDLCIRTKKIFPHEHTLYPPDLLQYRLPSMRLS